VTSPREHGDRGAFLGRLAGRLRAGVPPNRAHPAPPPPAAVPEPRYVILDEGLPLVDVFMRSVQQVAGTVERHEGREVPADALADLVERLSVRTAVVSAEPEAAGVGEVLAAMGVAVAPYGRDEGAAADLGVTSAIAGIATTGSVVVDSRLAGGRGPSLLPRAHLCVLPAARIVATPADVFRRVRPDPLPSNLVLITGPSRTGDIEQIITLGVHGPIAVHVVVTGAPVPTARP
jgi:L-lactate dehydrogenase complex protein LldG